TGREFDVFIEVPKSMREICRKCEDMSNIVAIRDNGIRDHHNDRFHELLRVIPYIQTLQPKFHRLHSAKFCILSSILAWLLHVSYSREILLRSLILLDLLSDAYKFLLFSLYGDQLYCLHPNL